MKEKTDSKNMLSPLFSKHLSKMEITGYDIETYGEDNNFYMGSIYGDYFGYKKFYDKEEFIKELERPEYYGKTLIFATNLGFDLTGLYYNTRGWNNLDIILRGGKVIIARLTNIKRQHLIFLDTLNFAPISVEGMGKILGIPKLNTPKALGRIPKNDEEKRELEIYNKRDSEISYKFMVLLRDEIYNLGGILKATIASTALDLWRRVFLREILYKEDYILKRRYKEEINFDVKEFLYLAYFGGRTESFSRGYFQSDEKHQYKMYDINSLYPSVMINEYPHPNYARYIKKCTLDIINKYEGVCEVELFCPNMKYPLLPVRYDTKLIFPKGFIKGNYTHVEIRRAIELGYKVLKLGKSIYYKKTFEPFKEYVQILYSKRKTYKKRKDKREIVVKLLLNSLYGKFAEKEVQETTFFNTDFLTAKEFEIVDKREDVIMKDDKNGMILETKPNESVHIFPIFSLYTTAYARIKLHKYLIDHNALYCDTDSIITLDTLKESPKLGDMKLEYYLDSGYIVKPKMYCSNIRFKDGTKSEIVKIKGVPKKLLQGNIQKKLDVKIFKRILNGETISYNKFTKLKEAVRRGLKPNSVMKVNKYLELDDSKRVWIKEKFSTNGLTESVPITLTREDYIE